MTQKKLPKWFYKWRKNKLEIEDLYVKKTWHWKKYDFILKYKWTFIRCHKGWGFQECIEMWFLLLQLSWGKEDDITTDLILFMNKIYCINKAVLFHLPGDFLYIKLYFWNEYTTFPSSYVTMLATLCLVLKFTCSMSFNDKNILIEIC